MSRCPRSLFKRQSTVKKKFIGGKKSKKVKVQKVTKRELNKYRKDCETRNNHKLTLTQAFDSPTGRKEFGSDGCRAQIKKENQGKEEAKKMAQMFFQIWGSKDETNGDSDSGRQKEKVIKPSGKFVLTQQSKKRLQKEHQFTISSVFEPKKLEVSKTMQLKSSKVVMSVEEWSEQDWTELELGTQEHWK